MPRPPAAFRAVMRLTGDVVTLLRLRLSSRAALAAENLCLRKQLALYRERHAKPRRADPATRVALGLLRVALIGRGDQGSGDLSHEAVEWPGGV